MRGLGSKAERTGWAKAPPVVEAEIRAVWQEDELPNEITQAPGFRPFTLGPDSQEWVDSMAEIVDGGDGVYGRPKPVLPPQHRQLSTPTSLPSGPPIVSPPASPGASGQPPPRPRVLMPDVEEAPPPMTPHTLMPEIDEASPSPEPHVLMPEVDDLSARRPRTLPRRIAMPEIGEEQPPATRKPPSMPEIG